MRLEEYLDRIGVRRPLEPTASTLRRLHEAHRETFLFENVSIQEGSSISVAGPDIERKFLDESRGGYCFEQNTLFAAGLRDCGFDCTTLLGRVRRGPPETRARTHMVLRVVVNKSGSQVSPGSGGSQGSVDSRGRDDERLENPENLANLANHETVWLADVGFGAIGLVEPIPLRHGAMSHQRGLTYLLRREGQVWVLSMEDATQQTMDLYEFSDEPHTHMDVVVANHYTSTHPESIFRRSLTIQGIRGDERIILRSHVFTHYVNGVMRERPIDRTELRRLAQELFGVELPDQPLVYEREEAIGLRQ